MDTVSHSSSGCGRFICKCEGALMDGPQYAVLPSPAAGKAVPKEFRTRVEEH